VATVVLEEAGGGGSAVLERAVEGRLVMDRTAETEAEPGHRP
jgi:hypothetical protein